MVIFYCRLPVYMDQSGRSPLTSVIKNPNLPSHSWGVFVLLSVNLQGLCVEIPQGCQEQSFHSQNHFYHISSPSIFAALPTNVIAEIWGYSGKIYTYSYSEPNLEE